MLLIRWVVGIYWKLWVYLLRILRNVIKNLNVVLIPCEYFRLNELHALIIFQTFLHIIRFKLIDLTFHRSLALNLALYGVDSCGRRHHETLQSLMKIYIRCKIEQIRRRSLMLKERCVVSLNTKLLRIRVVIRRLVERLLLLWAYFFVFEIC